MKKFFLWLPLGLLLCLQVFPILVVALTSLKSPISLLSPSGIFSFQGFSWENYVRVFQEDDFLKFIFVSLRVAVFSTLLSVLVATPAAFALSRIPFRGRGFLALTILCSRMSPPVALALPVFLVLRNFDAIDSEPGLIFAHMTFSLPFAIWLMLPFFSDLPRDYEEAAALDGAKGLQIFTKIMMPLALPGMLVTGVFCFLLSWNDFLFSLILAGSSTKTAPLMINAYMTADRIEWGPMTASSIAILLPAFLLCLTVQKHMIGGMNAGGVKG